LAPPEVQLASRLGEGRLVVRAAAVSGRGLGVAAIRRVDGLYVKRCAGCKTDKPLGAFSKGTGPGGLHRHCRDCCRQYRARKASA
jgi:hypothetical protein